MSGNRKLNVWVLSNEYQPKIVGGLGIVATRLTRALSMTGTRVTVLCANNAKRLTATNFNNSLRILRFPRNSQYFNHAKKSFKGASVMRVASRMAYAKPNIIHVHSTDFGDTAIKARNAYRVPVVYTCHSLASQGLSSPIGKNQTKLIRIARRIVVPSKWQAAAIKRIYPNLVNRQISVIPHGVTTASKKSIGSPTRLLYAGRLIPSKGIASLLTAISILSRDRHRVHLTIVGSGLKSYQRKLRTLAKKLGIADRIRWINHKPHHAMQKMYSSYGAVIVPSRKESFCLVALEAMANGVPLISTLSGGLKEFVNSSNAHIIPSVNGPSIAGAIRRFRQNPSLSRKRVSAARATAAKYKWPAIARRYRSLFTSL
ncbi:glycosyltransferase family 4 protein [Paenibacillaceae bacterium WGS1546]|uniref:glycosyltransferase family 4 protein n=1 Tax=Cohnella sp. WGS1546 TaxID=3366810 RepID=UPI00372D1B8F